MLIQFHFVSPGKDDDTAKPVVLLRSSMCFRVSRATRALFRLRRTFICPAVLSNRNAAPASRGMPNIPHDVGDLGDHALDGTTAVNKTSPIPVKGWDGLFSKGKLKKLIIFTNGNRAKTDQL